MRSFILSKLPFTVGFKIAFFLCLGLSCSIICSSVSTVLAEGLEISGEENPDLVTEAVSLESRFKEALSSAEKQDFQTASDKFLSLSKLAETKGWRNLPEFSARLLSRIDLRYESMPLKLKLFLIDWADKLSKTDSRTQLACATYLGVNGLGSSFSHFVRALELLPNSPVLVAQLLSNFLLLVLTATTLAVFLVCVLQLVSNSQVIVEKVSSAFPLSVRGILGPICVGGLVISPLFMGLLAGVIVWSLLLAYAVRDCRLLGVFSGGLVILWAVLVPQMVLLGSHLNISVNRTIEILNNAGYVSAADKQLSESEVFYPSDPLQHLLLARLEGQNGKLKEAKKRLEILASGVGSNSSLGEVVRIDLAGIYQKGGQLLKSRQILDELVKGGAESFALFYNLANVNLALTDIAGHRENFLRAKSIDAHRLDLLTSHEKGTPEIISKQVSALAFIPRFMRKLPSDLITSRVVTVPDKGAMLLHSLLSYGGERFLLMLGIMGLMAGVIFKSKAERFSVSSTGGDLKTSLIWCLFPAGPFVCNNRPVFGLVLLSVFIFLVMAVLKQPLALYAVHSGYSGSGANVVFFISMIFLLSLLLNIGFVFKGSRRLRQTQHAF